MLLWLLSGVNRFHLKRYFDILNIAILLNVPVITTIPHYMYIKLNVIPILLGIKVFSFVVDTHWVSVFTDVEILSFPTVGLTSEHMSADIVSRPMLSIFL